MKLKNLRQTREYKTFVEIISFHEPMDYKPPKKWFAQYEDQQLNAKLMVKRGIRNIPGSTLTTNSVTRSVRRALAAYEVLIQEGEKQ